MRRPGDRALTAAWITGILLAGWILWFFTASPRENGLKRQVNLLLSSRGEGFSLAAPLRGRGNPRKGIPLGTEFSLEAPAADTGGELRSFLVFPLVSGGTALSCGALIDSRGRVERLIPLGAHSEQAFERIPRGILDVYIRRIEGGKP